MRVPAINRRGRVVGRAAIGEQIDDGPPVALALGGGFDDGLVDFGHQGVQRQPQIRAAAQRQPGRVKRDDFNQRHNGFGHARKRNHREKNRLQRLRIGAQRFDDGGDSALHFFQVLAHHRLGTVEHKKHR